MPNFPTTLPSDASLLRAKDFAGTTLRASMTNVQATAPVTDASIFPDPAGATYYAVIDAASPTTREIITYTGRDLTGGANALTGVVRGQGDPATTGVAHNSGVTIELNNVTAFHELPKAEIVAIATKVGVNSSAVNTTHDFKLSGVATADKAASLTGAETLTNKTATSLALNNNLLFNTTSAVIIQGPTDFAITNHANTFNNLYMTDAGAVTFRSTVGGITTLTATTVTATNLGGTLTTAAQSNITSLGTLTSLTVSGTVTLTAAASKIVPGATSFSHRNNADNADNLLITDAGVATIRAGLTVTTGGLTVSGGGANITGGATIATSDLTLTAGNFIMSAAASQVIPGATSLSFRNNANSADNLLISNAGVATIRAGLTVTTGKTVLGANFEYDGLNESKLDWMNW